MKYLLSFTLLTLAFVPQYVAAQDESEQRAFKNQWVISTIPALQEKALDAIDKLTSLDLNIQDTTTSTILVTEEGEEGTSETVPAETAERLCKKLREARRLALRAGETLVRSFECSPNYELAVARVPNDSLLGNLWGMNQSTANPPSNIDIDAPEAWDVSTGSQSTIVAVIDTGVDYTHPDLAANIWTNPGEIAGNGIDDDANGYVDDIHGINAITGSGNPMDDHGHGTHCAGTIGGVGNNSSGVVGVSWNVKIIGAKFLAANGNGSLDAAIRSIDYVTSLRLRGYNVVASNNSWGGGGYSYALLNSIRAARDAGVLFIAAAGNNSNNNDASPTYPANYDSENIITVAAIDKDGSLAYFSNYGATTVDVAAPGVNITSSIPGGQYANMSGTSMATPHVTGIVALLSSYATRANWSTLKDIVLRNGLSLPSLQGKTATGKLVKTYAMLQDAQNLGLVGPPPTPPPTATPRPTNTPLPTATPLPSPTPTPTAVPGYKDVNVNVAINGIAVPQAKVIFRDVNGVEKIGYTAADGKMKFYNLFGPVMYTIDVIKGGYTFSRISAELRSTVTHNISGTAQQYQLKVLLTDPNGAPLAGASVNAGSIGTLTTDSSGRVMIPVLFNEDYSLTISKSGYDIIGGTLTGKIYGNVERRVVAIVSD